MYCEKCKKNEATVFYRENVNGNEKSYSLCSECAEELEKDGEISLDDFFGDYDPMGSLFSSLFAPSYMLVGEKKPGKRCPLCGSTFDEIASNGKVGCPKCYETFGEELAPTLRRIHGKSTHTGHAPSKLKEKIDRRKQIASLESEMKDAIKAQEFERAAEIRDKLRKLRSEK